MAGAFGNFDWATDILPVMTALWDNSIIKGAIPFYVGVALVVFAATGMLGIFLSRR